MYEKIHFFVAGEFGEKIVFKYDNNTYIINEEDERFYLYNKDKNIYKFYKNFHEMLNVKIFGDLSLKDILNDIEIISIEYSTKKRFVSSMKSNREIEFEYNGVDYFKSCSDKGYYIHNSKDNSYQYFETPEELLEKCKLEGKNLNELWDKIFIQCIF